MGEASYSSFNFSVVLILLFNVFLAKDIDICS